MNRPPYSLMVVIGSNLLATNNGQKFMISAMDALPLYDNSYVLKSEIQQWCYDNDVQLGERTIFPSIWNDIKFYFNDFNTLTAFRLAWL